MPRINVRLFGGLDVTNELAQPLTISGRKTRALFGFLLAEADRSHTRDRLIGLLWADRADTQARNSLNQALYEIRKLETETGLTIIEREADRIRVADQNIELDLRRFEACMISDTISATDLCTGELLEGLDGVSSEFADWLNNKRSQVVATWSKSLRNLVAAELENAATDSGIAAARKLLELDPLDEGARRSLMLLLVNTGQRAEALRQFQVCVSLLKDELGIEPEEETQRVAEEIRAAASSIEPTASAASMPRQKIDSGTDDGRPLIAVFPFENLSDDPDAFHFADGLTEDVIFELGKFRWFAVLARASTFQFRGQHIEPNVVRQAFGATHLVSGRVRKSRGGLVVAVELTDCNNGAHVWANRYDVKTEDLFDVEFDIAQSIAATLEPSLEAFEYRRVAKKPTSSLTAYESTQRGFWHAYKFSPDHVSDAQTNFDTALAHDPSYSTPMAGMAFLQYYGAQYSVNSPADRYLERIANGRRIAGRALQLDPEDLKAIRIFAMTLAYMGEQEEALAALQRAIGICPSYAAAYSSLAYVQNFRGDFEETLKAVEQTVKLRALDPIVHLCSVSGSVAHYQLGDYAKAEQIARDIMSLQNSWWLANAMLIASLSQQQRLDEARSVITEFRNELGDYDLVTAVQNKLPFSNPAHRDHLVDGLQRAGLSS